MEKISLKIFTIGIASLFILCGFNTIMPLIKNAKADSSIHVNFYPVYAEVDETITFTATNLYMFDSIDKCEWDWNVTSGNTEGPDPGQHDTTAYHSYSEPGVHSGRLEVFGYLKFEKKYGSLKKVFLVTVCENDPTVQVQIDNPNPEMGESVDFSVDVHGFKYKEWGWIFDIDDPDQKNNVGAYDYNNASYAYFEPGVHYGRLVFQKLNEDMYKISKFTVNVGSTIFGYLEDNYEDTIKEIGDDLEGYTGTSIDNLFETLKNLIFADSNIDILDYLSSDISSKVKKIFNSNSETDKINGLKGLNNFIQTFGNIDTHRDNFQNILENGYENIEIPQDWLDKGVDKDAINSIINQIKSNIQNNPDLNSIMTFLTDTLESIDLSLIGKVVLTFILGVPALEKVQLLHMVNGLFYGLLISAAVAVGFAYLGLSSKIGNWVEETFLKPYNLDFSNETYIAAVSVVIFFIVTPAFCFVYKLSKIVSLISSFSTVTALTGLIYVVIPMLTAEKLMANPDEVTVYKNSQNNLINVLKNDVDPRPKDENKIYIKSVSNALHGIVSKHNDTCVDYTPPGNDWTGTDEFEYTMTDGVEDKNGNTAEYTARVTVSVTKKTVKFQPFMNRPLILSLFQWLCQRHPDKFPLIRFLLNIEISIDY